MTCSADRWDVSFPRRRVPLRERTYALLEFWSCVSVYDVQCVERDCPILRMYFFTPVQPVVLIIIGSDKYDTAIMKHLKKKNKVLRDIRFLKPHAVRRSCYI